MLTARRQVPIAKGVTGDTTLELVWGGISCFIALSSLLVAVFAWKTSASSKHLDEKIELAIQRFENTLDAKFSNSFSTEANVKMRFEMVERTLTSLDHRSTRNAEHIAMLLTASLNASTVRQMLHPNPSGMEQS